MSQRKIIGVANAFEKAVRFNGSDNLARTLVDGLTIQIGTPVTYGLWCKLTTAGNQWVVLMGNEKLQIEIGTGGNRPSFTYLGHWNDNPVGEPLKDLKWHFVVVTFDQVTAKIYLDGTLLLATAHADVVTAPANGSYQSVGAKHDSSSKAPVSVKGAFICDTALTAAQISDLFNIGPLKDKMVAYLGSTLKALWAFNNDYADSKGANTLTAVATPVFADVNGSDFDRGLRTLV